MQIEEGKFYRTRDGRKVGPMEVYDGDGFSFCSGGRTYNSYGGFYSMGISDKDLVSEWSDTPQLLGDMTDAEIGALVRAWHEGKVIEGYSRRIDGWVECMVFNLWHEDIAYRIKPEPVRETVTIYINEKGETVPRDGTISWAATRAITFDLIDGEPDPASIKMERVKW